MKPARNVLTTLFVLAVVSLTAGVPPAAARDQPAAGQVVEFRGGAFITRDGASRNVELNMWIYPGDRIVTGAATRLRLKMIDESLITLGDHTEFVIAEYHYNPQTKNGFGRLELIAGFFRAVTGRLGKTKNDPFEVRTELATIGVRGTDFWGEQSRKELRVALIGGTQVYVENDAGRVVLDKPGYGTTVVSRSQAPAKPFKWSDEALRRAMDTVK